MSQTGWVETHDAAHARAPRRFSWAWAGVLPFFLFAFAFLILPALSLLIGSFQDREGNLTLDNIIGLTQPAIVDAYWLSIRVSLVTAIGGALFGFLLAYAAIMGGLPPLVRSALMTFSGVASNFAGVPLAFAFIFTIGNRGLVTLLLNDLLGVDIYGRGFSIYTFWGLCLTYMYFQFPLMILIIAPALDGLKREWREASENLGASSWQYWRYVALPILLPSLLGTAILLFGNSFGAYATAYALAGSGALNLVPIVIGAQIRGDVLNNPNLGYALALGMVVIMGVSIALYTWLQRKTARWVRQ
jgi:putative spermidine/putrescine transport system permease protein